MNDVRGVAKVCKQINKDIEETNNRINHRTYKSKRIEDKVDALCDHIATFEAANVKKEGHINYLEGVTSCS